MIDTNKATELHSQIADLIRNEKLLEAFDKMKILVGEAADWNLRSEFENLEITYHRMLQFILQDMEDPERGRMYYELLIKGLILNDRLYRVINIQISTYHYYKTLRDIIKHSHLTNIYDTIEWLKTILQKQNNTVTITNAEQDSNNINRSTQKELESASNTLFNTLWTSDIWSPNDREAAQQLLDNSIIPDNIAALCISAITLGIQEMYDPQKYLFLFDAYNHPSNIVNQRAVVGIAIGCLEHDNRMRNSFEILNRVETMTENPTFKKDLQNAQMQILRSRETEKINKFMNEEFIPEMLKNPFLKKDKTGLDSLSIDDNFNPEWEKWIDSKEVKNKMNIMSELYSAGADVHMASFANMKNFPFFRTMSNWFMPFDPNHSEIADIVTLASGTNNILFNHMIEGSEFCDSDCYSLFLFFSNLPGNMRQTMEKDIPSLSESMQEQLKEVYDIQNNRENVCRKYVQNIYRFFKLFSRRHEFTDIFKEETNLQFCDTLQPILSTPEHINEIAMFLFNQKHFEEAELMYNYLEEETVPTFESSQKRGFCLQQLKKYTEAIEQYEKADLMRPDNLWNIIHLAQCYNCTNQQEKAAEYYLKAEAMIPDDLNLQLQVGNSLAKLGRYDEAFKRFFKVHYLDEKSITVWRAIAWYSLMDKKMEQAERFYQMIENNTESNNELDLLNIGHMHWINHQYKKAVSYYKRCCDICGEKTFRELLLNDYDSLMLMNVSPLDLSLILDLIKEEQKS